MSEKNGYEIQPGLIIPEREIWFEFSHAGGPGGQNVNKVATAATLCFHPDSGGTLTPTQKALAKTRLRNRINSDGVLRITASNHRTQAGNRAAAGERFRLLLADALRPPKTRLPTRPSRTSIERRLVDKRLRSARKLARGKPNLE